MDDLTKIKGIGKAAAAKLVAEGIDTFEKLAQADVKAEWKHEAETIVVDRQDTEGKPPLPDDEHGTDDGAPADGGVGDPQKNTPEGSSGTAREAPSTDGGTSAETPTVGTQSGSPHTNTGGGDPAGSTDAGETNDKSSKGRKLTGLVALQEIRHLGVTYTRGKRLPATVEGDERALLLARGYAEERT